MQTTKETVIVAAVHTHTRIVFKKIKIIIEAILCYPCGFIDTG